MKILVVGRSGQLARALSELQAADVAIDALGRPELDLEHPEDLAAKLRDARPDVVVNAAAHTAVDLAETDEAAARRINAGGPAILARAAYDLGAPILHISTDYVFPGDKSGYYAESDQTGPRSVYGQTKLEGERGVAANNPNHVILRTAWVFSHAGKNFVRTMLRLATTRPEIGVVDDQRGCPTYSVDLAQCVLAVAQRLGNPEASARFGVYHAAGSGETSWAGFAEAIFEHSKRLGGPAASVKPITTSEYPTPAMRPANSRLDCSRLAHDYGYVFRPWREALRDCMEEIAREGFAVS